MIPIKTIRNKSEKHRKQRAEKACELLITMENNFQLPKKMRWEFWEKYHAQMVAAINRRSLLEFQSAPDISPPIVGGGGETYLKRMQNYNRNDYVFYMNTFRETVCGSPKDLIVVDGTPITRTSMRHLYHLCVINSYYTRFHLENAFHLEVGGGFGNLTRLFYQYNMFRKIIVVDFPALIAIQYFYITEFIDESDVSIWDGKKYLVGNDSSRVCLVTADAYSELIYPEETKLFFSSTMAMTEISKNGQEYYLADRNYDFMYIFGQTTCNSAPGGKHLDNLEEQENKVLFNMLIEKYSPILFNRGDYYTEFLGQLL